MVKESKAVAERIETKISPDVLDLIGREFRFSHAKGISEWLKNSLDIYLLRTQEGTESISGQWPAYLHLVDGGPNVALIDFGGASFAELEDFLLVWFKSDAATRGGRSQDVALTGGHGNGGKFYMREMFRRGARFTTISNGRLSSLVVDKATDGTTGFWEVKDEPATWEAAVSQGFKEPELGDHKAVIDAIRKHDPGIAKDLDSSQRGLTIVVGRAARQMNSSNDVVSGRAWRSQKLIDEICVVSGAYRPLRELEIRVLHNGRLVLADLDPLPIEEDPQWPPQVVSLPAQVVDNGITVTLTKMRGDVGGLTLRKSLSPLSGVLRDRNAITVMDAGGNPIGTFGAASLAAGNPDLTRFLFGELSLLFPEIKDSVSNDRESLLRNDLTNALRSWVADQVRVRTDEIEREVKQKSEKRLLEEAAQLNQSLNDYARKFLQELETEVFVDWLDDEGGGEGGDGTGGGGKGRGRGSGGGKGIGGGRKDKPGTEHKVRRPRFPRILLSGFDDDPATNTPRVLSGGHPPIYQNESDLAQNIWWINTSHPYADEAIQPRRGGPNGQAWRAYHLFMFRDIVQVEHMRMLRRREAELPLDQLEQEVIQKSSDFLSRLSASLAGAILD